MRYRRKAEQTSTVKKEAGGEPGVRSTSGFPLLVSMLEGHISIERMKQLNRYPMRCVLVHK
jgi:hypothetical protein